MYALNLYSLMMPVSVIIDDRLLLQEGMVDTLYFSQFGVNGSAWGPLLEKAMAKYHGSYEAIHGRTPPQALHVMAGSPH